MFGSCDSQNCCFSARFSEPAATFINTNKLMVFDILYERTKITANYYTEKILLNIENWDQLRWV